MVEQAALDHVTRCWAAEETNAERIAHRKTLIVGLPAGFLAFVGLNADHVVVLLHVALGSTPPAPRVGAWGSDLAAAGVVFLGFGLLALFVSAGYAVGLGRSAPERAGLASQDLLPGAQLPDLLTANREMAQKLAFDKTAAASIRLHKLNTLVEQRLALASEWLVTSLVLCFLALLIYASVVP